MSYHLFRVAPNFLEIWHQKYYLKKIWIEIANRGKEWRQFVSWTNLYKKFEELFVNDDFF